jgi:hypothetical protein
MDDLPVAAQVAFLGVVHSVPTVDQRREASGGLFSIVWVRVVREAHPEQLVGGVAGHRAQGAVDTRKAGARPVT